MKKLLLLFTLISTSLYAQDAVWFETGASWTYQYQSNGFMELETHEAMYVITEQTTVSDQVCAKMEAVGDNDNPLSCNANPPAYYFYESNDSIFFASDYDNTFRLAYDFGAEEGDAWEFTYPVEMNAGFTTYLVTVDSVSTTQQEGQDLKVLYLDYALISGEEHSAIGFDKITIIEKIGATQVFMVPFGYWQICEAHFNTVLKCYTDANTTYIGDDFEDCTVGLDDVSGAEIFQVSPNPSHASFVIHNSKNLTANVEMYSINGSLVYSSILQNSLHRVNTDQLASGLYVLQIRTDAGAFHKKIILE